MARSELWIAASRSDVFAVLADGHSYEHWVVGCKRIRAVDASWPHPAASFYHCVGFGPVYIRDMTTVVSRTGQQSLQLEARAWPAGVARVDFELAPEGLGTKVLLTETLLEGPAKLLDNPVQQALINLRNFETLRRLSRLVLTRVAACG